MELAVGATLLAGAGWGVVHGARELDRLIGDAHAARAPAPRAVPEPRPHLHYPGPRGAAPSGPGRGYFLGVKDEILLGPLLQGEVTRVKFNRGGSSVSLRIDFTGGGRAAFKPEQINLQSVPRREIAAYRVSRLLGIESVAPAVGRRIAMKDLVDRLDPGSRDMLERIQNEVLPDADGMVPGELSWWIPVIVDAKIEGVLLDTPEGIGAWRRYLTALAPEPYGARHMLPQISSMVVFDYLINNSDRFSGSNAKASPDGRTLFYMDNTLSFGADPEGSPKVRTYLEKVQKFSRALVRRARELEEDTLRDAMTRDCGPYDRLLSDGEIAAILYRREQLLAYIDALVAEHGAANVLVYP
jgi:hypothetical protein